ncbi:uncharacterized protein LOC120689397 [Panicum virgatum]|uniref:uncharacterized protein LOC120689397 n=1 Tax=Panicum virgatum TaxID=38727 RepID=UPI0019D56D7B|nr:uncharacterized protein LOC120689397 [Panicum virgatum]
MARGAQSAQQTRAQEGENDAGQSGAVVATWADAEEEAGRGGAENTARPDAEVEPGQGATDNVARPDAGDEAGQGSASDAAQPEAGGGGSGGDAQERPTSREEGGILAPGPPRAGVEGATAVATVLTVPVAGETLVPELARAGDEGAAAAATAQMAPENVAPVVELPLSEEYGESEDIDPAAAASAAARIAEFVSASEGVFGAGTSEGPGHGADYVIVQSRVPSDFAHAEREEEQQLSRLYARVHWLDRYNATLVTQLNEANARSDQATPLEARIRGLERELARANSERDAQRAAADQKAQEAEAHEAELRRARAGAEAELQRKEVELQREKATVTRLAVTLTEKDVALEAWEVAVQEAETALKDKDASLSASQERADAAQAELEEAQGCIKELRKVVADETAAKEAVQIVLTVTQGEHTDLEQTAVAVCQELEGEGASSGSSVANRLRSLGGRVAEHIRSAFRLGVQRTLGVASTHYNMDLMRVSSGYVFAPGVEGDAAAAAMDEADAPVESFAAALSKNLEDDILPLAEDDAAEDPLGHGAHIGLSEEVLRSKAT